jgi:hypothetical protein
MRLLRRHRFLISFLALLVFCSVMVIRQYRANQSKHIELREAFILLYTRGYKGEAERIYNRLIKDLYGGRLPNGVLDEDYRRTLLLVDPTANQPENLIWKYHWSVANELDKRSESTVKRALKLAEEQ